MKKYILVILSIIIVVSSISITCFAVGKPSVAPNGSGNNKVVISDNPEMTKTTTLTETTKKTTIATDPVTTNMYQYAESLKNTTEPTTKQPVSKNNNKTHKIYTNATFITEVPDTVPGDISITLYNKTTKDTFTYKLPKSNDYFLMVEIPVGQYVYTEVNIPGNENGRFIAEYGPFSIGYAMNCIVSFNVIDKEATTKTPDTTDVINTNNIASDLTEPISSEDVIVVQPKNENNFFKTIIPIIIIILLVAIYIFKKYNKKNIENDDAQSNTQTPTNRF